VIRQVLLETIVVADLDAAVDAWTGVLGFEVRAAGQVGPAHREAWGAGPEHRRFAIVGGRSASRGFVRLLDGGRGEGAGGLFHPGLFNAELYCADADALHARLAGTRGFALRTSEPHTYDLSPTGGAIARSFAATGPGGAGVFFTQLVKVPPPRTLPSFAGEVGPLFNCALHTAGGEAGRVEAFFVHVLGMARRFDMRVAQPSANRILGLPDDWVFHMTVYKGEGDGLVEVDRHEHAFPEAEGPATGLPTGNAMVTLETGALPEVLARAEGAGFRTRPARALPGVPYDGRQAALAIGPAGVRVELIAA
jgi:catechol 2,3-dioxygenase-like lactoylglutathione lyase family enzyme